jgi:hypothetical protein
VARANASRGRTKIRASLAACICATLCAVSGHSQELAKIDRVVIAYVDPTNRAHETAYNLLKEQHALERVRDLLIHVRWPRTLKLELKGCEGVSNAWYENDTVTVCYEYLEDLWKGANSTARPGAITREDAFVGPFIDVFLHEAAHAIFDLLKIPVLGREEDAADQLAAYYVLQFPKEQKRRLILASAYTYARELKVRRARDLRRPRLQVARHVSYADEHSTPAQRLYNLLCIAYGSDIELFADLVEKQLLPKARAEQCEDEYRSIDFAYRTLIAPHVDRQVGPDAQRP